MKKPTKSIITSSLLAVAFGALSVGSTFALFTSQSKTEISVGSGIVNVESKATLVSYQSTVEGETIYPITDNTYENPLIGNRFALDGNTVTIDKMVPGDVLTLKLSALNKSNVKTKTRFMVSHATVGTKGDLFPALEFTFNAGSLNATNLFRWQENDAVPDSAMEEGVALYGEDGLEITIAFPDGDNGEILFGSENHDNQYQDCACSIAFGLEAVQGNAATSPIDEINAYLSAEMLFEGQNKTMHDAVLDMKEIGFNDLSVLTYNNVNYVYSLDDDQFVKESSVTSNFYRYFRVYSEMPDAQTFSIYAADNFSDTEVNDLVVGFDAGDTTSIITIEYDRTGETASQNVVIRTNSASTNIVLNPYVDSTDSTKGDHISFYGKSGQITGPKDEDGNYIGFTVAFNSIAINGKVLGLKAASGHIDLTNAVVEENEEIIILATTTDVKVSNPNNVSTHAHATSESNANAMNDPIESTKKSIGVIWDYDGNVAQNEIDDIHHHISEKQATEAGESLGTGPVDGSEWNYEEVVEKVVYVALNEEVSETASYVARIGGQGYETLEAAFTAAVNGDTIVMLKNVSTDNGTYGTSNYINISKTITLDLAGYGVTNNKSVGFYMPATATVGGVVFTIDDNSNSKTGYIISSKSHGIQVGSKNYIVVNNGRIEGIKSGIQASQYCSVTINDGVVKSNHTGSDYCAGIYSSHYDVSVIINGGTVIGKRAVWVGYTRDSLTVNGGTIEGTTYGVTASNGATVVVNDGTIKATGAVLANYGIYVNGPTSSLTVNGGTITAKIKAVQASYATVNIAGGTFTATGYNAGANDSYALLLYGTTTTITGGKFVNDNAWTTSGKYQYGIFFANVQDANKVVTNGSLSVKYADITATQTGVYFSTNAECIIKDCNITATECIFLANSNAVCTVDGGNYNSNGSQVLYAQAGFFKVNDGIFTGSGSSNLEDHIYRYTLNCLDSSYNADPATAGFTVTGGSFYQFNPSNDLSEGANTCFTPDGYHTEYDEETGYYTVVADE